MPRNTGRNSRRNTGRNTGRSTLPAKRHSRPAMQEYDRLPAELRRWLAGALLPWRPRSVARAFDKALARTGDRRRALAELDQLQRRLIARDAAAIWGRDHPDAG